MSLEKSSVRPVILFFPFPFLSHYLRCIVLARLLQDTYRPVFAAHPDYDAFVVAEEFETFPCATFDADAVSAKMNDFDFSWLDTPMLDIIINEQCRAIDAWQPRLVITDNMPTVKIAAGITGTLLVSVLNTYMTKYYSGIRSITESHYSYQLVSRLPAAAQRLLIHWGESASFRHIHKRFRMIRSGNNLEKMNGYLDELEGDLNLCVDMPELFSPNADLPSNYRVIGPLIFDDERRERRLFDQLDPNKKTILISMGSTGNWDKVKFLHSPLFAVYNLITAGDKYGVLAGAATWQLPFINAKEILPFVDLVFCHGGNGTLYQALKYAKPVLCSASHFEQQWNIDAWSAHGLGSGFKGHLDAQQGIQRINEVINMAEQTGFYRLSGILAVQQDGLKARILNEFRLLLADRSPVPATASAPRTALALQDSLIAS